VPAGSSGSTASGLQGQVWDWSRSTWTDVAYQDNGTTVLPDSAVDSDTGLIRVKLSTSTGFLAGAITLSGTVR
jgi:hypothetical protein